MDSLENYRIKLKEIADYAFSHGLNSIENEQFMQDPLNKWDKEAKKKFMIACHEGFKLAQILLIDQIRRYQQLQQQSINELKLARRKSDKVTVRNLRDRLSIIERRLYNFSHIANGMAWQLLGGQIHIARRLHIGQNEIKSLENSNIEHALKVAAEFNKVPEDFALISDLTNFLQIGDLLVKQGDTLKIIELKEGEVNNKIHEFVSKIKEKGERLSDETLNENFDATTVKQAKRMQRQIERGMQASELIANDKGVDPRTGNNMTISTPSIPTEFYNEELGKLHGNLKDKTWAYTVIDSCVHIGIYRDEGILMANSIELLLRGQTANYIVIDWLSITENLSQPIFLKPFPQDFIIDILTGHVKVIMGINLDSLIDAFNHMGLKTRWLSTKETAKSLQITKNVGVIVVNKKAIGIKISEKQEMLVSGGILSKILYDTIKPSNIALSILLMNKKVE